MVFPNKALCTKRVEGRIWPINYSLPTPGLVIKTAYKNMQCNYNTVICFIIKVFYEPKGKTEFHLGEKWTIHL